MDVSSHSTADSVGVHTEALPYGVASARALARNSAFYFAALSVPVVAALVLVPVTVRGLGAARFGLLALAWAVGETAGMFDFGLGRATVRFVAHSLARRPAHVGSVISISLLFQTVSGVAAGALVFLFAPLLATRVFSIPAALVPEALAMFRVLAFNMPLILLLTALRAVLEGLQRFDLNAAVRIPSSLASIAIPAFGAAMNASLPTILWLLLAARLAVIIGSALTVRRALAGLRWEVSPTRADVRELLAYSGWVAISTFLGPALGSFDKFALGSVRGVTALGYYTGAIEAATRFLLLPITAFAALLPAFAASDAMGERARALAVARAARRQLIAVFLPICVVLFVFSPQILSVWLGPRFAELGATALRVFSVGIFLAGLAHLPLALLYGAGRSDLPAKIHLAQVVVHLPLTVVLVRVWGINGAALAWALRATQDLVLYEWAKRRAIGKPPNEPAETHKVRMLTLSGSVFAAAVVGAAVLYVWSPAGAFIFTLVGLLVYARVCWSQVLHETERRAWASVLSRTGSH